MATAGRNVWRTVYRHYGTGRPAYWRGSCYGRCHFWPVNHEHADR